MSISIPLPEWINRASNLYKSNEDYMACAITVAIELTKCLSNIIGSSDSSTTQSLNFSLSSRDAPANSSSANLAQKFAPWSNEEKKHSSHSSLLSIMVQLRDIVPENVIVTVGITNFNPIEVNIVQPSEEFNGRPRDIFETNPQLTQQDACFALGGILFELFSQGEPLLQIDRGPIIEADYTASMRQDSFNNLLTLLNDDDAAYSPTLKKSSQSTRNNTASSASQTMSMKANAFLQERGLPRSICRLVIDLLEAEEGNLLQSDTALLSLEEALFDLTQMRSHPQRFLHDETCPTKALDKTCLFQQVDEELYGREMEMGTLIDAASRVALHAPSPLEVSNHDTNDFLCEAIFLSGHSGSGKSTITRRLISFCEAGDWFVLICKFDRQVMPMSALLSSLDTFFGSFVQEQGNDGHATPRDPSIQEAFDRMSRSMVTSIDSEIFGQICELLPNLCKLFPLARNYQFAASVTPPSGVGYGSNRLRHLFHVLFKAVCGGGLPVAIVVEDLQWSDSFTADVLGDFIRTAGCGSTFSAKEEAREAGSLLLVANYRDNEVSLDGFLMDLIRSIEESKRNINVSRLVVGELPERAINKMLSFKFCLPIRHTRELARLVHCKTRGFPMYIIEFLRSIIQRNMMSFSVKSRKWRWDDILIDIQMISGNVAELLTRKLQQLSHDVIETLKVLSCFGQMNTSTIQLLDLGQFVPDMVESLEVAMKEGIVDKAGPIFAFSHDMLQESTYNLIPVEERKLLHVNIGRSLAQDVMVAQNAELCTLAVDQINISQGTDNILNPAERARFAWLNLVSGKHSISASSYEQARGYLEAGIRLLHAKAWDKQYSLCLELHELSVVVSFMDGNVETVSSLLGVILSNTKSFDDALNSRVLRAKFLASQEQYSEATNELLDILSHFGEEFSQDACLAHVMSEIKAAQLMLKEVTKEKILNLPTIQDTRKINAMEIMGLLIALCNFSSPMLVPLLCCRLMKLTFEFGFCEDTISGLAFVSHALLFYSDDVLLAARVGRIAESLISGNIHEHSLRAKLTQMTSSVKVLIEPFQVTVDHCLNGYNSAKIVGDIDNAMLCGLLYCISCFFSVPDLIGLQRHMVNFFHQMTKHKRIGVLHSVMSYFDAVTALIGNEDSCSIDASIERNTNEELYQIAEQTQSTFLMHHVIINQMYVLCYLREHLLVADLVEKYRRMYAGTKNTGTKRVLDVYFVFFEGISALCLARDTKQKNWRQIGEESAKTMSQLVDYSAWNFENKLSLLQAELHHLNQRNTMAELAYQASISSAHAHRFFHEEAMAQEMYGIYLIENKMVDKGIVELETAMGKYESWGAARKVDYLKDFIELVNIPASM